MAKSANVDKFRLSDDDARARTRSQIRIIQEALGRENVAWDAGDSDDPADFRYLYQRGSILVRDTDLPRVDEVLNGRAADSLINGLTLYELPSGVDALAALARLDEAVGRGVGTPNHLLYVTGGTGGCCPATEPEETRAKNPVPPASGGGDGDGVLVSVVDTGWYEDAGTRALPWLAGVTGDLETVNPADIHPYAGHGTFIAGVVRCMAPRAEVRVEGFLPHGGAVFEADIVRQLDEALALGPDIISLSAGTWTRGSRALLSFEVFWETRLRHLKGTVLVAAAGNDGARVPFWPAAFPWTVSVGALTPDGARAPFTNFGSWVDLYARGVDLVNAYPSGTFVCREPPNKGDVRNFKGMAQWSGTSFATPLVAGLIAARMSRTGESARLAADALLADARASARPGVGAFVSEGLV